jgi:hypothetical protein
MSFIPFNLFQKRLMRFAIGDEGARDERVISKDVARVSASLLLKGLGQSLTKCIAQHEEVATVPCS